MANPTMRNPTYWYDDKDMNAVAKALRNQPSQAGVHVHILDVVNGQQGANVDARNIEWNLNKETRLKNTAHLTLLSELCNLDIELTFDSVMDFINQRAQEAGLDEGAATRLYEKARELEYNRANLRNYFNQQAVAAVGKDLFDDINPHLNHPEAKIRVLFPLNLGQFDPTVSDTGSHWVLGECELTRVGNVISVDMYKRDSMQQGSQFSVAEFEKIERLIRKRLQETLGNNLDIQINNRPNLYPKFQFNGYDCGPSACYLMGLRKAGQDLRLPVPGNLREAQYRMIGGEIVQQEPAQLAPAKPKTAQQPQQNKIIDPEIFKNIFKPGEVDATLTEDGKITTKNVSLANLKSMVEKYDKLADTVGLGREVFMKAPTQEARKHLEALCKKHNLVIKESPEEMLSKMMSRQHVAA